MAKGGHKRQPRRRAEALPAPRIVATEGTVGGRPRMDGTRLDLRWYAYARKEGRDWIKKSWPYLTDAHLDLFEAVYSEVLAAAASITFDVRLRDDR